MEEKKRLFRKEGQTQSFVQQMLACNSGIHRQTWFVCLFIYLLVCLLFVTKNKQSLSTTKQASLHEIKLSVRQS